MDSQFVEGTVRAPLSALQPTKESLIPAENLTSLLRDPSFKVPCLISVDVRDALLRDLGCDTMELRTAHPPPLLKAGQIICMYSEDSLDHARATLGAGYTCILELYCIPPKPRKSRDGDVFRSIRFHMSRPDMPENIAVAQAWMDVLSNSKKHVLSIMLKRPRIMEALDSMLSFPGHWDGLQLGNWAKHLAAHLDFAIINYWNHIKKTWETIMSFDENLYHLVRAEDVVQLQHRAPAWSRADRDFIEDAFASYALFRGISDAATRARIKENILSLRCVIPSIKTFHENMRYITIGAKILENGLCRKITTTKKDRIEPAVPSLLDSLSADWRCTTQRIQVSAGVFTDLTGPPSSYISFLVLLLAALRDFPYLSSEQPILDIDKRQVEFSSRKDFYGTLCAVAQQAGFSNAKIDKGSSSHVTPANVVQKSPALQRDWRAGKPPLLAFELLQRYAFIAEVYKPRDAVSQIPDALFVHSDLFQAFFPCSADFSHIPHLEPREEAHTGIDATMSDCNDIDMADRADDCAPAVGMRRLGPVSQTRETRIKPGGLHREAQKDGAVAKTNRPQASKTTPPSHAKQQALERLVGEAEINIPAIESTVTPINLDDAPSVVPIELLSALPQELRGQGTSSLALPARPIDHNFAQEQQFLNGGLMENETANLNGTKEQKRRGILAQRKVRHGDSAVRDFVARQSLFREAGAQPDNRKKAKKGKVTRGGPVLDQNVDTVTSIIESADNRTGNEAESLRPGHKRTLNLDRGYDGNYDGDYMGTEKRKKKPRQVEAVDAEAVLPQWRPRFKPQRNPNSVAEASVQADDSGTTHDAGAEEIWEGDLNQMPSSPPRFEEEEAL